MGAFYETKKNFIEVLSWNGTIGWDEWMTLSKDKKAAALYLNFYNPIMTAWNKVKSFYTAEEDGVSTMLQYLVKNTPILEKDSKKYTERYIYRVAFNCLYCICHDIKSTRETWENEVFDAVDTVDGESISLFSYVAAKPDRDEDAEEFWGFLESMGPETMKVVYSLINQDYKLNKLSRNNKRYNADPLRDIEVTVEKAEEIVEELKVKLAQFKELYY